VSGHLDRAAGRAAEPAHAARPGPGDDEAGRFVMVPEHREPVGWAGPADGVRTVAELAGAGVTLFGAEPVPAAAVTVAGRVAPQGSKSAFSPCHQDAKRCARCRRAHLVKINQVEKSRYLKAWRGAVAAAARAQFGGPLLDGPLSASVIFSLERPGSHYLHRKAGDVIRPDAPRYPADTPDLSKLLRATEDALTGTVWVDDARVVTYTCLRMVYAQDSPPVPGAPPGPGAMIVVTRQA
jgi:Holliday junction resolvase RusA-like endonuclease